MDCLPEYETARKLDKNRRKLLGIKVGKDDDDDDSDDDTEEKAPKKDYGIKVGDLIAVVDGTWRDTEGKALKIDDSKQTVTINVEMFGRETPLEVPLDKVRRMG